MAAVQSDNSARSSTANALVESKAHVLPVFYVIRSYLFLDSDRDRSLQIARWRSRSGLLGNDHSTTRHEKNGGNGFYDGCHKVRFAAYFCLTAGSCNSTGTCSTISIPKPSSAATFLGRLVSRRIRRRSRSDRICAPLPISR